MAYIIVQIALQLHPRAGNFPKGLLTGMGCFVPVSCDGFYHNVEMAHEVATLMNEEYPSLQTVIAEVVCANDPYDPYALDLPEFPRNTNRAPAAFKDKAEERAKMTPDLRYEVIREDGYRCRACGFSVENGAQLQVDHIVAVVNGGKTKRDNLQTLCTACNLGKGAK